MKRWMFFHPNDGTVPYPPSNDSDYTVLWERIADLENQVSTFQDRILEQNRTIQRYASTPDPNVIRTETVVRPYDRINFMDHSSYEDYQRENEQSLMTYLREHNYFNHQAYCDFDGLTRVRTSLRILDNPN